MKRCAVIKTAGAGKKTIGRPASATEKTARSESMDRKFSIIRYGEVYNVRWLISPAVTEEINREIRTTKHAVYKSFLVCRNIYMAPEWVVLEKQPPRSIDGINDIPEYKVLDGDMEKNAELVSEIVNFVKSNIQK